MPLQWFTMGHMPSFAKVVRGAIALRRFPRAVLVRRPLLHRVSRASNYANSHSSEQGTHPTAALISKEAIPYRTHGSTYHPGLSTPNIQSLADSSMTIHITWQNPTVSTIPAHAQTTAAILTTVTSHLDGWRTNTLNTNTSQTQHHKDQKTCTTLMTAWLSNTTHP
jgi:hypothetical protein